MGGITSAAVDGIKGGRGSHKNDCEKNTAAGPVVSKFVDLSDR